MTFVIDRGSSFIIIGHRGKREHVKMAAVTVSKFLRIAWLCLLLSSSYAYTGVFGSDSRCSGECLCELGDTCRFVVNASTTLQVVYQLNQTTENEVSVAPCGKTVHVILSQFHVLGAGLLFV